jgi:MYXO-CTERM domain-containing protein
MKAANFSGCILAAVAAAMALTLSTAPSRALQPGGSVTYSIELNSTTSVALADPYLVLIQPNSDGTTANVGAVSMGSSLSLTNTAPTTGTVNFGYDTLGFTTGPSYYSIIGSIGGADLATAINPSDASAANGVAFSTLLNNNQNDLTLLQQIANGVSNAAGLSTFTLTDSNAEDSIISGLSLAYGGGINNVGIPNVQVTPAQLDFATPIGNPADLFEFSNGQLIGSATVVPEPAAFALLALPALALLALRRRRRM